MDDQPVDRGIYKTMWNSNVLLDINFEVLVFYFCEKYGQRDKVFVRGDGVMDEILQTFAAVIVHCVS